MKRSLLTLGLLAVALALAGCSSSTGSTAYSRGASGGQPGVATYYSEGGMVMKVPDH
jgi:ABC-type glycerol-3-phosphate transport system substrate-binding protein